jgi:hypothetical protein
MFQNFRSAKAQPVVHRVAESIVPHIKPVIVVAGGELPTPALQNLNALGSLGALLGSPTVLCKHDDCYRIADSIRTYDEDEPPLIVVGTGQLALSAAALVASKHASHAILAIMPANWALADGYHFPGAIQLAQYRRVVALVEEDQLSALGWSIGDPMCDDFKGAHQVMGCGPVVYPLPGVLFVMARELVGALPRFEQQAEAVRQVALGEPVFLQVTGSTTDAVMELPFELSQVNLIPLAPGMLFRRDDPVRTPPKNTGEAIMRVLEAVRSGKQFDGLTLWNGEVHCTQRALARACSLSLATVSGHLKRLHEAGELHLSTKQGTVIRFIDRRSRT